MGRGPANAPAAETAKLQPLSYMLWVKQHGTRVFID
jgi:hypothetical protein